MDRVVPKISLAAGKVLSLKQISRSKDAAIQRSAECFRLWIERGVVAQNTIVHMPHIRIGRAYYSSLPGLVAFLEVLQGVSQANTAKLSDQFGPPVIYLKGDPFAKRGRG